ncbi:YajQ family cyclic di-GMP-binding protein [Streptomyces caniscabiei]|uniref:YajQ family cyclic di-GMP-binding protein n=1 Tax=Streptomyces caniscabiei TaxID=2746961 RepID=UPI0029AC6888|nr:YajQ family cyclic di-GMP-binding protein [Streptomyces caniscabiei]MDX2776028.1 YajQ family cyclic di-GMP-binding protein [Streptomyces caniscabiei]
MPSFSFDIVSDYDKAEMNNVFAAVEREIASRFDFKGTPAAIEWLDNKSGFKITGAGAWQCDTILDIVRKKLAGRNQSTKTLDTTKVPVESNLKATLEVPFKQGLSQENAKKITKQLRDEVPKVKAQIQGDAVRVTSSSKDELQKVIALLNDTDYDIPLQYINYR